MPAAYIEHRPYSSSEYAPTSHFVIVVNGQEAHGAFSTQDSAKKYALKKVIAPCMSHASDIYKIGLSQRIGE